jgi:hypothetical protein
VPANLPVLADAEVDVEVQSAPARHSLIRPVVRQPISNSVRDLLLATNAVYEARNYELESADDVEPAEHAWEEVFSTLADASILGPLK